MLRYDIESKEAKLVPQTNQASLYLPSETELQTAQVSFLLSAMFCETTESRRILPRQ